MTATVTATPEAIAAVEAVYEFHDRDEVIAYLEANGDLIDLLLDGAEKIPTFVVPSEPIFLEVLIDPEDEAEERELFAVVPTADEPEAVLPRLHRLRREWLIDAARHAVGRFNVGVEYR